jgi:hypothetical protein
MELTDAEVADRGELMSEEARRFEEGAGRRRRAAELASGF